MKKHYRNEAVLFLSLKLAPPTIPQQANKRHNKRAVINVSTCHSERRNIKRGGSCEVEIMVMLADCMGEREGGV
jgi:hypothetical protein